MADMTWPGLTLEAVEDLTSGSTYMAGVSEGRAGRQGVTTPGQTAQSLTLLLPGAVRLTPPTRLRVRDLVVRVLGTQMPPDPGGGALVACEAVHPDLPDAVEIYTETVTFDPDTNLDQVAEAVLWSGSAHLSSADPRVVEVAGALMPAANVVVTLPPEAPADTEGAWLRVTAAINPALRGARLKLAGDVLDSTSPLRRVVARDKGAL